MAEKTATVQLKTGLQARPAALFVQEANRYQSTIHIIREEKKANAKSIMGIMSLAIRTGTEITIQADGNDAEDAVETLASFIEQEE
ncbi:HPr family phosphocarrier protein [Salsuginibacillus kocurii]|uniref:HPr family phosphocarrier protein n=1 Tax=Salsuginibacillus kocurii TaxID=427078 RepID=UPI00037AC139|nr:HPr family phosphocarrier protein [Salsuginibacillus kocurii]